MKYLLIFHAKLETHESEVVREVDVNNADELRGEIEMIGEEISEKRGVFFRCEEVEVPDEDEFDDYDD